MVFCPLDTETSGLDPRNSSLLTLCLYILSSDLTKIGAKLHLQIKEADGQPYLIHPGAMDVNKINIVEHHKVAVSKDAATQMIIEFLTKWTKDPKTGAKRKLIPVAHNWKFDESFLLYHLPQVGWHNFFELRDAICTKNAAGWQKFVLKNLPAKSTSLENLMKHYGLSYAEQGAHDADADSLACIQTMRKLAGVEVEE